MTIIHEIVCRFAAGGKEVVDSFDSIEEAREMIKEYRLAFQSVKHYGLYIKRSK